mmetsp:Transcript_3595/g.5710  ORF Transcript_3595/g.5710 Transcript_3595/m.5710 type:complete len:223 (-) Transcript_3595:743-1411(-)
MRVWLRSSAAEAEAGRETEVSDSSSTDSVCGATICVTGFTDTAPLGLGACCSASLACSEPSLEPSLEAMTGVKEAQEGFRFAFAALLSCCLFFFFDPLGAAVAPAAAAAAAATSGADCAPPAAEALEILQKFKNAACWKDEIGFTGFRTCSGLCAKKQILRLHLSPLLHSEVRYRWGCKPLSHTPCAKGQRCPRWQLPDFSYSAQGLAEWQEGFLRRATSPS